MRTRVASSDWWASRNVVSVTASGVWARSAAAKPAGPSSSRRWRDPAGAGCGEVECRQLLAGAHADRRRAVGLVHGDVGEPVEDLGAAVLRHSTAQQLRALVDERGAEIAGDECRVVEHALEEGDVGGDASDAELGEGALGTRDRCRVVAAAAGELREHGVEVRADLRAGVDGAAVEADARAAGRAVRRDLAGVGAEAGRGVFGRDAALQGGTAKPDGVLGEPELGEGLPRGDAHLRRPRGRRR